MAWQRVPNTMSVNINMLYLNVPVQNNLYVRYNATISVERLQAVAQAAVGWWASEYAPLVSNQCRLVEVVTTDLNVQGGLQHPEPAPPNENGALTSPPQPGSLAFCVSFRTGRSGRNYRGRNYTTGLTEGQVTGNFVDLLVAQAWQAAYTAFPGYISEGGYEWVVVSRELNNAPRTEAITEKINTVTFTTLKVASQRERTKE